MKQKNILILGLGAFGFTVAKHLGNNNPNQTFYASEVNPETFLHIENTREQPYFFPGIKLPENIELVNNAEVSSLLPNIDIIISVIPCQFTAAAFVDMKPSLKEGVIILNLSKGIDNQTLETMSEKLSSLLNPLSYAYSYLAGGMIAEELVNGKMLGADIVTENAEAGIYLKDLFESENLAIQLKLENPKNTELYAALKNIVALILGYYEGQGSGASTLGYYFTKLLGEINTLIQLLSFTQYPQSGILSPLKEKETTENNYSKNDAALLSSKGEEIQRGGQKQIDFTSYALSGDLIATCFGNSRNRLLGNMLGKGSTLEDALAELKAQKKIAEGYETLKAVKKLIEGKDGFEEIGKFCVKFL